MPTNPRSEKLRMHGFMLGAILFVASLFVASSVTAVINLVLIAIPVLTILAVIGIIAAGIPLIYAGIHAGRQTNAFSGPNSPMLLSLEGFWKRGHSWDKGHPHFVAFGPIDREISIHPDSRVDESMTMREYSHMTTGLPKQDVGGSLEGLTDYHRV